MTFSPTINLWSPHDTFWTPEADDFRAALDVIVLVHVVDPTLPEIEAAKQAAPVIVATPGLPAETLRAFTPYIGVSRRDGVSGPFEIRARNTPYGLQTWSLARHHQPEVDTRCDRVAAHRMGTTLYAGHEALITFADGAIGPNVPDQEVGYRNACRLIYEFTGVGTNWRRHVGRSTELFVSKTDDEWTLRVTPDSTS